jgi:hypothetical protein
MHKLNERANYCSVWRPSRAAILCVCALELVRERFETRMLWKNLNRAAAMPTQYRRYRQRPAQ